MIRINQTLTALHEWSMENQMEANIGKTMLQTFTLKHHSVEMDLTHNGTNIWETEQAVYLGVKFEKKFSWQRHIEKVICRARKRLTIIKDFQK